MRKLLKMIPITKNKKKLLFGNDLSFMNKTLEFLNENKM